jgi:hypothetical protein
MHMYNVWFYIERYDVSGMVWVLAKNKQSAKDKAAKILLHIEAVEIGDVERDYGYERG